MEDNKYKNAEENQTLIILGILGFYLLVMFFILYMFLLHRFSFFIMILSSIIFSLIYIPRFLIIKKILKKDLIKVLDNSLLINGQSISFSDILDYQVCIKNPKVVFFVASKMVVYNEAIFHLKLRDKIVSFCIIGNEKILLVKAFLDELLEK